MKRAMIRQPAALVSKEIVFDEREYEAVPSLPTMRAAIEASFVALGEAPVTPTGLAFAITRKAIADEFGGDTDKMLAALPRPDYEHAIFHDEITNNYIVARPNAGGKYSHGTWQPETDLKRVR